MPSCLTVGLARCREYLCLLLRRFSVISNTMFTLKLIDTFSLVIFNSQTKVSVRVPVPRSGMDGIDFVFSSSCECWIFCTHYREMRWFGHRSKLHEKGNMFSFHFVADSATHAHTQHWHKQSAKENIEKKEKKKNMSEYRSLSISICFIKDKKGSELQQ